MENLFVIMIMVALSAYFVISYKEIKNNNIKIKRLKAELISLFVKRANLMPNLLNTARKHHPVPLPLYNAFVSARDRFSNALRDEDVVNANNALTKVFTEFFSFYSDCKISEFLYYKQEYSGLIEKISFTQKFLELQIERRKRLSEGFPCRPAFAVFELAEKFSAYIKNKNIT